jgi:hypothetical protein
MKQLIFGLLATLCAGTVHAQTATDLQDRFLAGCEAQGNDADDCTCIYQNWSKDFTADDEHLASDVIAMSFENAQPAPSKMAQLLPLVMGMTDVLMRCSAGELSAQNLPAAQADIPQTGDAKEEALLLQRLTAGEASITEMMRYDQLVVDRRAVERKADLQAQADKDARATQARATLRAEYEASLAQIHSRTIAEWAMTDLRPTFILYCKMGGASDAACACGWDKTAELAHSNVLPYLASRSEGDDILEYLTPGEFYAVRQSIGLLNERRALCDDL